MGNKEVLSCIRQRKSIRRFEDRPVESEVLARVTEAARLAPTACNRQNLQFHVLGPGSTHQDFVKQACRVLGREKDFCYGAPYLIFVSFPADSPMGREDMSCALMNMMLQCSAEGLGSVRINQFRDCYGAPELAPYWRRWGIGEGRLVYSALALGWPAEDPEAKKRLEEVFYVD